MSRPTQHQRLTVKLTALRRSLARVIVEHRSWVQEDSQPGTAFADADEHLWSITAKLWRDAHGVMLVRSARILLDHQVAGIAPRPGVERDLRRAELERLVDQVKTLHDAILNHQARITNTAQRNIATSISLGGDGLAVGEVPFGELDQQLWLTGEATHTEATSAPTERQLLSARHAA